MIDPPTEAEWLAWAAAGEARTCRDCGARGHLDGGVVADPTVAGSWLCEDCAARYTPCESCDRACAVGERDARGYCDDCSDDAASDADHYRATASWLARVS